MPAQPTRPARPDEPCRLEPQPLRKWQGFSTSLSKGEVKLRVVKTALGIAVLGSWLLSGTPAFGAPAVPGGTIKVWAENGGFGGTVAITGAIGDYGKAVKADSAGKADNKGSYTSLVLKKGTILIDASQLRAAVQNSQSTDFNAVTCSGSEAVTAAVPIVSGTKAYAGIAGSLTATATFVFIAPLTSNGTCNTSNKAKLVLGLEAITGSGPVSFS